MLPNGLCVYFVMLVQAPQEFSDCHVALASLRFEAIFFDTRL